MNYIKYELILENPKRIEIYLSGCAGPHCKNCHNPETWDFNEGTMVDENLIEILNNYKDYYDHIWILGGEPLDQDKSDLILLINRLFDINKIIGLWTRYDLSEIDIDILKNVDFVKCGTYDENKPSYVSKYGIKLASINQEINSKGECY